MDNEQTLQNNAEIETPLVLPEEDLSLSCELKGVKDTVKHADPLQLTVTDGMTGEETEIKEDHKPLPKGTFKVLANADKQHLFNVYVDGVDVRDVSNPVIIACPWVFSWKRDTQLDGWMVLDGNKLPPGLNITVSRDDTPKDKIVTIGHAILCYQAK